MAISKSCLFCLDLGVRKRGKVGKEDKRESGKEFMEYFGNKVGGIEFEDAEAANLSLFIYAPVCTPCRTTFIKIFNNFKKIQSLEKEVDGMVAELSDRVIRSHWKEQRSKVTTSPDSDSEGEEEGDVLLQNIRWFRQKIVEFEEGKGQRTRGGGKWAPGKGKGIPKKGSTVSRRSPAVKRPTTPMQITSKSVKKAKKQVAVSRGKVAASSNSDFEDIPMDYEQNYNYNSNNDDGDETSRAVAELERLNNNDTSPQMGSSRVSLSPEKQSKVSKSSREKPPQVKEDGSTKRKQKRRTEPMATEIIVCNICNDGRIFNKLKFYKYHMRRHHGEDHRVTCPVCDKSICDRVTFILHMFRVHEAKLNDKPFSCSICGKKFAVEYLHKRHEELHTLDATKPLKCSFCEERYPTSQEKGFLKHQHSCNIKGNGKAKSSYNCGFCNRIVRGARRNLGLEWSHNAMFHQDKLSFSCAECGDKCCKFPTENLLKMHDRIYHSAEPGPFECLLCPLKYLVVDSFLTHFLTHYFHRRCEYCDRWFYNSFFWLNHNNQKKGCQARMTKVILEDSGHWNPDLSDYIERVTTQKEKEAEGGGKIVSSPPKLVVAVQYTPRVFTCDICTLTFNSATLLEVHTVENHDDIFKLLECEFCGEKFMTAYKRLAHVKLKHTKTFICEICGSVLASEVKRERHMRRKHRPKKPKKPKPEGTASALAEVKSSTSGTDDASASTSTTANVSTTVKSASELYALTKGFPKVTPSVARASPKVTRPSSASRKVNVLRSASSGSVEEEEVQPLKTFRCPTCRIRFTELPALTNHIQEKHSQVQTIDHDYLRQPSFILPKLPPPTVAFLIVQNNPQQINNNNNNNGTGRPILVTLPPQQLPPSTTSSSIQVLQSNVPSINTLPTPPSITDLRVWK